MTAWYDRSTRNQQVVNHAIPVSSHWLICLLRKWRCQYSSWVPLCESQESLSLDHIRRQSIYRKVNALYTLIILKCVCVQCLKIRFSSKTNISEGSRLYTQMKGNFMQFLGKISFRGHEVIYDVIDPINCPKTAFFTILEPLYLSSAFVFTDRQFLMPDSDST